MTTDVVTAARDVPVDEIARTMRERGVGSVVITGPRGRPTAMITDRDLALRVLAAGSAGSSEAGDHATAPLVSAGPKTDLAEATALMVRHRVRRLPVVDGDRLVGIVTLDDIAVRTGDLEAAREMTVDVIGSALPSFYFHDRRG